MLIILPRPVQPRIYPWMEGTEQRFVNPAQSSCLGWVVPVLTVLERAGDWAVSPP